jgi:hypothetical protein
VDNDQLRAAGRVAGKMARNAGKDWVPVVKNSGKFVKHVVPAAVKPLHSLWHEVLAFIFLAVAAMVAFNMWREAATLSPLKFVMMGFVAVVTAGYGISSVLKARRISRS